MLEDEVRYHLKGEGKAPAHPIFIGSQLLVIVYFTLLRLKEVQNISLESKLVPVISILEIRYHLKKKVRALPFVGISYWWWSHLLLLKLSCASATEYLARVRIPLKEGGKGFQAIYLLGSYWLWSYSLGGLGYVYYDVINVPTNSSSYSGTPHRL